MECMGPRIRIGIKLLLSEDSNCWYSMDIEHILGTTTISSAECFHRKNAYQPCLTWKIVHSVFEIVF